MERLTVEELARATGMTVRNLRAHQSRGLLPSPTLAGRTGYYGAEHVARVRLIQDLQAAGYNLAAIKDLIERSNGSADDALGFARALLAPFEREAPEIVDAAELAERYPRSGAGQRARSEALGLIEPLGDGRFRVPSPTLLRAGEAVVGLGVPLDAALDALEAAARAASGVSDAFTGLFTEHVWEPFDAAGRPDADWPAVRDALDRLRPLATEALVAIFHREMSAAAERILRRTG